jgi:hypothetical protein
MHVFLPCVQSSGEAQLHSVASAAEKYEPLKIGLLGTRCSPHVKWWWWRCLPTDKEGGDYDAKDWDDGGANAAAQR